ncbi:MAG: histone deacetylase [Desulfobulbaceae bacterium]|nr:histone deacetylase [Desulfobulbaceae bacterium]
MFRPFVFIEHPSFLEHDTGGGLHPEVPARVALIRQRLEHGSLASSMTVRLPKESVRADLLAIHDESYLFRLEEACLAGQTSIDHPDNQISYESFDVAQVAAASGMTAIDLLETGQASSVFCSVRPPGHHAERSRALGFCFLNNVAIAARYWQKAYQRQKIFIIDWDAHHGNGIQSAFERDKEVFYASIHEHPTFSFPGTGYAEDRGEETGRGATLNVPLPPGAGDEMLLEAIRTKIAPAIEAFQPEALIVAAGFDGHRDDDMSGLMYSTAVYQELGRIMRHWGECCQGRVVSILEGGYHLEALAASVEAYLVGLVGFETGEK